MLSHVSLDSALPGLTFTELALILLPAFAFLGWKRLSIIDGLQMLAALNHHQDAELRRVPVAFANQCQHYVDLGTESVTVPLPP